MKRPNIERMRKHSARSVPDVMTRKFIRDDDMQDEIIKFHEWFRHKMELKHPGRAATTKGTMKDRGVIGEVYVTMEWKPIRLNLDWASWADRHVLQDYAEKDAMVTRDLLRNIEP